MKVCTRVRLISVFFFFCEQNNRSELIRFYNNTFKRHGAFNINDANTALITVSIIFQFRQRRVKRVASRVYLPRYGIVSRITQAEISFSPAIKLITTLRDFSFHRVIPF